MSRSLILLIMLIATPVIAVDLSYSYVKLFQMQVQLAKGGDASAIYSLGEMHEQGMGTPVDINSAFKLYEKAASKGDVRAKHKLASRASRSTNPRSPAAINKSRAADTKRAKVAKQRARARKLLKRQRARAQADDMEDQ